MHKHARTTPAIRAEIAASTDRPASMAQRLGITEATVYKWKKGTSFQDCSHKAHRLQTILTPAQERVVVEMLPTLLLDDLLTATREFICTQATQRYLFVAIDRATRCVFVAIKKSKTAASAKAFLGVLHKACPIRLQKLPTGKGKAFTDRLFASRERQPTGQHEFDQLWSTGRPSQERREPTAWSSASTVALPMCSRRTAFTVARIWSRP